MYFDFVFCGGGFGVFFKCIYIFLLMDFYSYWFSVIVNLYFFFNGSEVIIVL